MPVQRTGAGRKGVVVAVVACLVVGLTLRYREYARSLPFWYDEAYLLLNVADVPFAGLCSALDYNLVIPAFFLWLERACFLAFGMSEWGMRLPAFAAGSVTLLVMVPLARRFVGGRLWWLPVALVALSRHAISHGAEVRPYTVDLLVSVLVLWTTAIVVAEERTPARGWASGALLLLAALGPWFSFPAGFGLAGASGALLVTAQRNGGWKRWALFVGVALVTGTSALALWVIQARHLTYPGMHEHWGAFGWGGFPDCCRPWSVLLWPVTRGVEVGNYGTREMGVALLVLTLLGAIGLVRRRPALAAAVIIPFVAALVASFLGKYPLAHRTTMFLLPALWLATAAGVTAVVTRFPGRRLAVILPLALLGPDLANSARDALRPTPCGTSTAFAHVRRARVSGDVTWVGHVEVYRTYYGREENVYGAFDSPTRVVEAARTGRVWVVVNPSPFRAPIDDLTDTLKRARFRDVERHPYHGVIVVLYRRE